MTDEKRKPGRPRKWSSDAERMRAARAAKRAKRLAAEERREVKRAERERASCEQFASSPNSKPMPAPGASKTGNTWMAVARMQEHDPDGVAWLDEQVRRWEARREGFVEDRRRLRRGSRKARHLGE